jgi:hypothetical protein
MNDKLLHNETYTIAKNSKINEKNYIANDSPRWKEKSIITSLINIVGTNVIIDEEDYNNLFHMSKKTMWKHQRNSTTIEK